MIGIDVLNIFKSISLLVRHCKINPTVAVLSFILLFQFAKEHEPFYKHIVGNP